MEERTIQETTDYKRFKTMGQNRNVNDHHVQALKKAIEEDGNLTKVVPVLVNQNFDIIDGQHRFLACKELGLPVYYSQIEGLGIKEARAMNVLQRNWQVLDYANSYAEGGNSNYKRYLWLRGNFGFNHSTTLSALFDVKTSYRTGIFKQFKLGEIEITDERYEAAKQRLNDLSEISEYTDIVNTKVGGLAFLYVMRSKGYSQTIMVEKLRAAAKQLGKYANVNDALREIENVYNWHVPDKSRIRLF